MNGQGYQSVGLTTASRYHDFSCGHRVWGHESKCAHLHGHNYRVHFEVAMVLNKEGDVTGTDSVGRVMDFSVIKEILCMYLENEWDHKFLVFEEDPWARILKQTDPEGTVIVDFNPTAENMAQQLVDVIAPELFGNEEVVAKYGHVKLIKCIVEETRKCSATYQI